MMNTTAVSVTGHHPLSSELSGPSPAAGHRWTASPRQIVGASPSSRSRADASQSRNEGVVPSYTSCRMLPVTRQPRKGCTDVTFIAETVTGEKVEIIEKGIHHGHETFKSKDQRTFIRSSGSSLKLKQLPSEAAAIVEGVDLAGTEPENSGELTGLVMAGQDQPLGAVDFDALKDVASEVGDVIEEGKDVIVEAGELVETVVPEALDVADAAIEVAAEAGDVAEAIEDVFDGTEAEEEGGNGEDAEASSSEATA